MKAIENLIGKKVIIRSDKAGIFYGTLAEVETVDDKWSVEIRQCRRIWYWDGACSITQLAVDGTKKPNNCKFTMTIDSIVVTGVIEILLCTEKSIKSIEGVKIWKI